MKRLVVLFWVLGLALFAWLVFDEGAERVLGGVAMVGLPGILAVCALYPVATAANTMCWRLLFPDPGSGARPRLVQLLWPHWLCDAINWLLPAAQVGGDVARAHLASSLAIPGAGAVGGIGAAASVVADITAGVLTEAVFALLGFVLLLLHGSSEGALAATAAGAFLLALFTALFWLAQRAGMFRRAAGLLRHLAGPGFAAIAARAEDLDAAVLAIYARRGDFLLANAWRLAGWLIGTLEVWLILYFLGHPLGLLDCLILESLSQAVRHAAFLVPGGLGVQEGGFILLGHVVGLHPDMALALSLVKRVREVALGLPALAWWQAAEGRRLLLRSG
jgi:putative membrane protein